MHGPLLLWLLAGEGYVRASAFGSRADILEAVKRFQAAFGGK